MARSKKSAVLSVAAQKKKDKLADFRLDAKESRVALSAAKKELSAVNKQQRAAQKVVTFHEKALGKAQAGIERSK